MITRRKVILSVSIFGSQFLSYHYYIKTSVSTKDSAELNITHVKHNEITTKSKKNRVRKSLHVQVRISNINHRYHGYYATHSCLPYVHVSSRKSLLFLFSSYYYKTKIQQTHEIHYVAE